MVEVAAFRHRRLDSEIWIHHGKHMDKTGIAQIVSVSAVNEVNR